jgi:hypothetical protein
MILKIGSRKERKVNHKARKEDIFCDLCVIFFRHKIILGFLVSVPHQVMICLVRQVRRK